MWCKLPSSANVKLVAGCTTCAANHVLDSKVAQGDPSTAICAD
jgi:hypothetical protein